MKTNNSVTNVSITKRIMLDVIKLLLFMVVFSTLFHNQLSKMIDSISDFAFHHYFFVSLISLFALVIIIEFEVFSNDHINHLKDKLKQNEHQVSKAKK